MIFLVLIILLISSLEAWDADAGQCGFRTTNLNGTIISPQTCRRDWASCTWSITVPEGFVMRLQITRFSLYGSPGSCSDSWLIIKGTEPESYDEVNKKLCGSQASGETFRFSNKVDIEYFSSRCINTHFTLVYNAERRKSVAFLTTKWIEENKQTLLDDKDRLPFAIPALYLFNESLYLEGNESGYKFKTQYLLKLSKDLLRNNTRRLSLADLSHHVTALLAICHNPRSYDGINLVDHLRQLADAEPSYFKPFDILTLCNAGQKMTPSDVRRLTAVLKKEGTSEFLLDFKAVSVMALICVKEQIEKLKAVDEDLATELEEQATDVILQESVNALKLHQKRDGGFGSLQTTALVYQALSAAGAHGCDVTSACKFICQWNHTDGSFGNLDDLYAVMPTLRNRTLLHINASNCDFSEDGATAVQDVKDKMTALISVTYQLWIGDETDVKHIITLKFPNGTSFVDVMRLAAEKDEKYLLKWTFVKDVIYVYEICNIINNPTSGKYWRLYTSSPHQETVLYEEGLEKYVPSDGDTAIMWYKTVDLSGNLSV